MDRNSLGCYQKKTCTLPWLIYIWEKTLGAFGLSPSKPIIKQTDSTHRFSLSSAIALGKISVGLGRTFWKKQLGEGLSLRTHTCNTAPKPESWLLNSHKMCNTRTFHLIVHVHDCVLRSFHWVSALENKGQIVQDSAHSCVSVMELRMSLCLCRSHSTLLFFWGFFYMLNTRTCAYIQACKHTAQQTHHSTPVPRCSTGCLEVIKLGGHLRHWEEKKNKL